MFELFVDDVFVGPITGEFLIAFVVVTPPSPVNNPVVHVPLLNRLFTPAVSVFWFTPYTGVFLTAFVVVMGLKLLVFDGDGAGGGVY